MIEIGKFPDGLRICLTNFQGFKMYFCHFYLEDGRKMSYWMERPEYSNVKIYGLDREDEAHKDLDELRRIDLSLR